MSVEDRVQKIVCEQLGVSAEEVKLEASFIDDSDVETTVLATVKNYGRLFPYISSIIMSIGLLIHLLLMIPKMVRRKSKWTS